MKVKVLTKQLMTALTVAGGLGLAASAQAQDIYYAETLTYPFTSPTILFANWGSGTTPTQNIFVYYNVQNIAEGGLEVSSTGGYGSGYFGQDSGVTFLPNGNTALSTNDARCILNMTVNPTAAMAASGPLFYTNYNWVGLVFILNMQSGIYTLADNPPGNNYSGWGNPGNPANYLWQGSNVTVTFNLSSLNNFTAYTQGGSNYLYGFNWGIDPAVILNSGTSSNAFDITLNSITFAPALTMPPNLSVKMVGTNIVIAWPDANTNTFNLQESQDPAFGAGGWGTWGFPPVWSNGTNTVVINPPFQPFHWFRLVNTNEFGPYVPGPNNINP